MEQEKDLQVIFIKDLLFAALYQWRRILAAALVFAVILGGAALVSQSNSVSAPSSEETRQAAEKAYEEQKLLLEEKCDQTQKLIDSQEAYNTQSPVMLLDPYGVYIATAELTVQTDYQILPGMTYQNPDNTNAILHAYVTLLNSNQTFQSLADAMDLNAKYLTELITLSNGGSSTRTLSITVTYHSTQGAEQILDILTDCAQAAESQIDQTMGEHSLNIVAGGVSQRIDLSIADKQTAAINRLGTLQTTLADLQAQQEALQVPALSGSGISVKKIVLFCIVGAVLGAGLVACIAWVAHIAGTKVYSARTLKNRTGVRILACVPAEGKVHPIDRWLRRLEGRSLDEGQTALAVAAIRNYCLTGKKVLVATGNGCTDRTVPEALEKAGIQAVVCSSLTQDAAAVEALPGCDAVVLLEKCGCSRHADVEHSMELVADQGKQVLGCILLNG